MHRPLALPVLLAVVLAVASLAAAPAAPAAASPQPTPVCKFCGAQFEEVALAPDANVTVAESTAVVQVHEDGSASWTVRNRLSSGAAAFREDPARLDRTARALEDQYGLPEETRDVSASLEGDTVVITAIQPDAANRRAGLLVVAFLHDRGGQPRYVVNADRFSVRAPEGQVVTNDPPGAGVDGATATWYGATGDAFYDAPGIDGSPYVVFGPDRSAGTTARTAVALGAATLPIALGAFRRFVLWQTVAFGVVLAGVAAGARRFGPASRVAHTATAVAGLGAVGAVLPALAQGPGWVTGPPLFGVAVGVLARNRTWRGRLEAPREQALAAAGALVPVFVVLLAIHALRTGGGDPVGYAFRAAVLALPFAALLPLGGALATGRGVLPWSAAAVAAFAAVPLALVDLGNPPTGLGGGLIAMFLFAGAVLAPALGALVLLLGQALAADDTRGGDGTAPGRLRSP